MAVIGNIRKHSTFLVIIIGVALAAFVLGDFTRQRNRTARTMVAGEVDDEKISIIDFNAKVDRSRMHNKLEKERGVCLIGKIIQLRLKPAS